MTTRAEVEEIFDDVDIKFPSAPFTFADEQEHIGTCLGLDPRHQGMYDVILGKKEPRIATKEEITSGDPIAELTESEEILARVYDSEDVRRLVDFLKIIMSDGNILTLRSNHDHDMP